MKIVIAMDSFKGSCSAFDAGEAVKRGALRACRDIEAVNLPMADGGEGTVDAVIQGGNGMYRECNATDPMGHMRRVRYGVMNRDVAVIEMSAASGMLLVDERELNPLVATSYGTGEMIKAALDEGYRKILLGLGGSATNDGGIGMLQALGISFRDANGREVGFGGQELEKIATIGLGSMDPRIRDCEFTCIVDVQNTLCGPNGASAQYGPQKGATAEMIERLERGMLHYAGVVRDATGMDILQLPGGGAAGGMGAAMYAFLHAAFQSGIDAVIDVVNAEKYLAEAELVYTGEGCIDGQTTNGKVPVGVARRAKRCGNIPVVALAGRIKNGAHCLYNMGIDGMFSVADGPISMDQSKDRVEELLEMTAEAVTRVALGARRARCR